MPAFVDEVLALAKSHSDPVKALQVQTIAEMLTGMAKREPGEDRKPIDRFAIEITKEGAMLVNGKPMGQ